MRFVASVTVIVILALAVVAEAHPSQGNIHPKVKLGFSERFRMVSWDNTISLSDTAGGGSSFTRHRTSILGQWLPHPRVEVALGLTNEFRYYFVPEEREFNLDEVIVDQAYVKWRSSRVLPGVLTLGRQNIILGEGFVVMEGHPLDGSRSIYFNAVRFDWTPNEASRLVLFYTYQPEQDDALAIVNDRDLPLIEQPEEGIGAYFVTKTGRTDLHAYVIRKNARATDARPDESHINTFGGRAAATVTGGLRLTCEAAYQFGDYGENDRTAFGGYGYLRYGTSWPAFLPQWLTAGVILLSGDDPETADIEGWDPLFSRWPKWSESYIYTQLRENGVAYWTNLLSLYSRAEFRFSEVMRLGLDYHHLMAPEDPVAVGALFEGTGKTRGELLIGKLSFRVNEHVTGHVLWEGFIPGNYYAGGADGYSWTRFEMMYQL